jgi:hypothetical protein
MMILILRWAAEGLSFPEVKEKLLEDELAMR